MKDFSLCDYKSVFWCISYCVLNVAHVLIDNSFANRFTEWAGQLMNRCILTGEYGIVAQDKQSNLKYESVHAQWNSTSVQGIQLKQTNQPFAKQPSRVAKFLRAKIPRNKEIQQYSALISDLQNQSMDPSSLASFRSQNTTADAL